MPPSLKVPPPKINEVYILGITGLPPQCKSHLGWQIVKDLVRVILEHHGLVDRNSPTKPGMVHISTSLTEASDADESGSGTEENDMNDVYKDDKFSISESRRVKKEVITAHINMKSSNTAWHAYDTIAGNRLWGYPLTAAVFQSPSGGHDERVRCNGGSFEPDQRPASSLWKACESVEWQQPYELADRFTITVPGGARIWNRTPNGKVTKVHADGTNLTKRRATDKYYHRMTRQPSDMSSCPTLVHDGPPPYQTPSHWGGTSRCCVQNPSWGWVPDCNGQWIWYQQLHGVHIYGAAQLPATDIDTPQRETSVKEIKGPIICCGDIVE